jgi:hypothetical protein
VSESGLEPENGGSLAGCNVKTRAHPECPGNTVPVANSAYSSSTSDPVWRRLSKYGHTGLPFFTIENGARRSKKWYERHPFRLAHSPMQLTRLWREHMAAGCPRELTGVEIAGADARELDAEINACVSALLCRSLTVDGRIERRLTDISTALSGKQAEVAEPVATYCARLNQLVSAVLSETRGGRA